MNKKQLNKGSSKGRSNTPGEAPLESPNEEVLAEVVTEVKPKAKAKTKVIAQANTKDLKRPSTQKSIDSPADSSQVISESFVFKDVTSGVFDETVESLGTLDLVDSKDDEWDDDLEEPAALSFTDSDKNTFSAGGSLSDSSLKRVLSAQTESPKLHKVLAQSGLGSRLEMEALIAESRVTVNNQIAHVGQRIQTGDVLKVNGHLVHWRVAAPIAKVIAYHKPVGEIVTNDDPQNRPTVFRKLPRLFTGKWQSVGRLDINTEGLLLFTNSGELANKLMHPRFGLEREYAVRVLGALKKEEKERLLQGVKLDDGMASFGSIEDGGGEGANCWYRVTINEGRNREVRRMFESVGHAVSRLIRIRYGAMALPKGLQRGHWMELGEQDVQALTQLVGYETHQQPIKRGKRISSPKSGPRAKSPQAAMIKQAKLSSRSRRGPSSYINPSEVSPEDVKSAQNAGKIVKKVTIGADSYAQLRREAKGRRRANVSSGGFTGAGKGADSFVAKPGSKKPPGRK